MPAYTMQLYMRAYKLNTKYLRIHCGCMCGIQLPPSYAMCVRHPLGVWVMREYGLREAWEN